MRVFSASLGTETNTFSPLPTGLDAFRETCYFPAGAHPPAMSFAAGPLWAARQRARERGWTVIEGVVAFATPAGITTRHAYETLRDELLADLRRALPVDVVVLGMHGAMVADGYDDCEGDLLARVREIVGPGVVIGGELDPHTHLSQAMVDAADLLIAFKEYPHTDIADRAFELVDLCAAAAEGRIHPVPAVFDCGMIAALHTSREPMRGFVDRVKSLEGRDGIVSVSPIHGFPWGDTPDMGTKVLVYANADRDRAAALAESLGRELIGFREAIRPAFVGIDAALDEALAAGSGTFVLADGADNTGGGAAGDSTFVLRRLLERGVRDAALGPLWDPTAVSIAFNAGEGARLPLRIGGKVSPLSGDPVDVEVTVKALRRELSMTGLSGAPTPLGDCALVQAGGVEVLLNAKRQQAMGTDMFTQMGCDPATKRIVVVKSSQHFYASYSKIAAKVIYLDAPGALTNDLATLPWRKVHRPKWGIDAAA
jgi:microcystin degradation protein MlrC